MSASSCGAAQYNSRVTRRQRAIAFFVTLCVLLVAAAVALIVFWVLSTVGRGSWAPVISGIVIFALIIAGLIVYTVFLVREMGITEQQDSFLNSVTHELKTPIASIRFVAIPSGWTQSAPSPFHIVQSTALVAVV